MTVLIGIPLKQSYGQSKKVIVLGTIENGSGDSVNIIVDESYLSKKQVSYKTPLKQNQFYIEIQLDRNRFVEFSYQGQMTSLYLEPADSLILNFNAGSLTETVAFSGKGAANNQFNKLFNEQFKNDFNTSMQEEKMKTLGPDEFEMLIFNNKKKHKGFFTNYLDKNLLSNDFKKYMENQIKYNYLDFLFSYPIVNANKSTSILTVTPLPGLMVDVLDKKKVNDEEAMICESYRKFINYFVIYFGSELNGFNKFKDFTISAEKKYVIARDYLKGEPFLYYLTSFLLEYGEKINPETVKRIYMEMEKEDKSGKYAVIVKDKLGKWMKTKLPKNTEGKLDIASSEFTLMGLDGKEFSLADYRGKVIYVDFWASWCGPCREQFPYSKKLHDKLSDKQKKEVVFLYISIDNTEEIWKKAVKSFELEGLHGLSPGGWNSFVAKYYQINSIPKYLLIDQKGNVVDQNAKRPSDDNILQDILNLLQ